MNFRSSIHKLMYRFNYTYRFHKWRKIHYPKRVYRYGNKQIVNNIDANNLIKEKIISGKPFYAARLGSSEQNILYNYFLYSPKKIRWDEKAVYNVNNFSGVFSVDNNSLLKFSKLYTSCLKKVDLFAVWFNEGEGDIIKSYCPDADLIYLPAIEPYYFSEPWSAALKDKKILVVHPFEDSIQDQYKNHRDKLFPGTDILPEFELKTIKAVQTLAGNKSRFPNWFDALDYMKHQIQSTDFDIAIIGAGAYGLPLAAYVKELGKQAIHMAGATQILFGIYGKRWDSIPEVNRWFNSYWKKPYPHETPHNAIKVENACYW
jgi:hypothetical protein